MTLEEKDITEYFIAQDKNDKAYFYCVKTSSSYYHRFSKDKKIKLKDILRLVESNKGRGSSFESEKTYCSTTSKNFKIIYDSENSVEKKEFKYKRYSVFKGKKTGKYYYYFELQDGSADRFVHKGKRALTKIDNILNKDPDLHFNNYERRIIVHIRKGSVRKLIKKHILITESNMEISFKEKAKIIKEKARPLIILTKEILNGQGEFIPAKEFFHDTGILEPIKAGIKFNKPVLLEGETGVGKTASVRFLAHETNNGFRRLNLSGSTTTDEFVGRWKLNKNREMEWIDGVLIEAMRKGYWLLCDEINAALPETTFVLHSLLDDDNYVVLSQKDGEIVRPHPRFRFFASMNPNYSGTHELNHALRDRFPIVVTVDYPDKHQERKIIITQSGYKNTEIVNKMIDVAHRVRAGYKKQVIESPFSTRRLIDWAKLINIFGIEKSFEYSVLNKFHGEDRKAVLDIADAIFPGDMFKSKLKIYFEVIH